MSYLKNTRLGLRDQKADGSINVLIPLEKCSKVQDPTRFFQYLSKLNVRIILFYGDFQAIKNFLDENRDVLRDFTQFEFSIVFRPDLSQFLRENMQKIDAWLLPRLFCNTDYFKRHSFLTKEIFHFYGLHPEVYTIDSSAETLNLVIKNIQDVDSVFLLNDKPKGNIYDEVNEISGQLNPLDGTLTLSPKRIGRARVIVLRKNFVNSETPFSHFYNYYDATAFAALQKWFKSQLLRLPLPISSVVYNLEEMFDIEQKLNGVAYSPNLEKVLKGIKKTIAFYYANSPSPSMQNIFLSIAFKRYFNSMLRPRFNVLSPQVHYLIHPDSSLAQLLDLNHQFIIRVNEEKFEIGTPYYWQTISSLKRAESQLFAETNARLPVLAYGLNKPSFSIPEQKFYIDLLAQAGATEFWWNADIQEDIVDETLQEFILSKIKYANQIGAFLSRGLPVGQILVLYPSLNQSQVVFQKILRELHLCGVPFELVNFDLFNSNQYFKIENGKINFNQKTFKLVLLPAVQVLPFSTLKKLHSFFKQGGQIVAIQKTPGQVERRDKQDQFEKIRKNLWIVEPDIESITFLQNENEGKSWFIPKLDLLKNFIQPFVQSNPIFVESRDANVLLRIRETQEAFIAFITNPSRDRKTRFILHSTKKGFPFYWDFRKKIQKPLHFWNWQEAHLSIPLTLLPAESMLLILQKELSTDVWHVGSCNAEECHVFSPKTNTFVVQIRNMQTGAVELYLQKGDKRLKVPVNIKEKLSPLFISPDHWILISKGTKKIIHLDDLPSIAFQLNAPPVLQKTFVMRRFRRDQSYYLDLGRVKHPCIIKINGQTGGRLWHYPFRVDISALLKAGENSLEIIFVGPSVHDRVRAEVNYAFPDPIRIVPYFKIFIQADAIDNGMQ